MPVYEDEFAMVANAHYCDNYDESDAVCEDHDNKCMKTLCDGCGDIVIHDWSDLEGQQ